MLAGMFIYGGLDALRDAEGKAKAADDVAPMIAGALGLPTTDTVTLVRINGGVQVVAGTMLALGKARRLSALVLAASLIPTTYAGHRFWEEVDEERRAHQRIQFLKNGAMLGGLILAAGDTGGRPSVPWQAKRAARKAVAVAGSAGMVTEGAAKQALESGKEAKKAAVGAVGVATGRASDLTKLVTQSVTSGDLGARREDLSRRTRKAADRARRAADQAHRATDQARQAAEQARNSDLVEQARKLAQAAQESDLSKQALKSVRKAAKKVKKAKFGRRALKAARKAARKAEKAKFTKRAARAAKRASKKAAPVPGAVQAAVASHGAAAAIQVQRVASDAVDRARELAGHSGIEKFRENTATLAREISERAKDALPVAS